MELSEYPYCLGIYLYAVVHYHVLVNLVHPLSFLFAFGYLVQFLQERVHVHAVHLRAEVYVLVTRARAVKATLAEVFFEDRYRGGVLFHHLADDHVFFYPAAGHLYFLAGAGGGGAGFMVASMFTAKKTIDRVSTNENIKSTVLSPLSERMYQPTTIPTTPMFASQSCQKASLSLKSCFPLNLGSMW